MVVSRKLPPVSFHGLQHAHVSALIAGGQSVYAISKRIGHSDPALTLRTYSHLLSEKDDTGSGNNRGGAAIVRLCRLCAGTNRVPISGFVLAGLRSNPARVDLKSVSRYKPFLHTPCPRGGVAEWLKAAVC